VPVSPWPGNATGGKNGCVYAARNASAAHDATDRVIYDTSSGRLYYDPDGTRAAPALIMATLQGAPPLAATDFTVW
jgi:serralysin